MLLKWKNCAILKCGMSGCTIMSKAKINLFWNSFVTPQAAPFEKISNDVYILALVANSATFLLDFRALLYVCTFAIYKYT